MYLGTCSWNVFQKYKRKANTLRLNGNLHMIKETRFPGSYTSIVINSFINKQYCLKFFNKHNFNRFQFSKMKNMDIYLFDQLFLSLDRNIKSLT